MKCALYLWFKISVADSLIMAMFDTKQELLEEELRSLFTGSTINLNAIKQLAAVGKLHHKEDSTLRLLGKLQNTM